MTNITFVFETSPNAKPKEKSEGDMASYVPPSGKVGGHVPHQIAPMLVRESERCHVLSWPNKHAWVAPRAS